MARRAEGVGPPIVPSSTSRSVGADAPATLAKANAELAAPIQARRVKTVITVSYDRLATPGYILQFNATPTVRGSPGAPTPVTPAIGTILRKYSSLVRFLP